MDNPFKSPAILSLCPGVLGLERGIERAIGRINVVAYVEIEAFIITNLVTAMEQGVLAPAPIWSDVKTLDPQMFRGKLQGIIGGYPCQPFSNAGNRLGTDDPRHLAPYILRIIAATRPVWCFFENVEGHLSLGYDIIYQSLRALGYKVESGVYSAEEVGATHQRKRLFIFAIRADVLEHARNGHEWDVRGGFREEPPQQRSVTYSGSEMEHTPSKGLQSSGPARLRQLPAQTGTGVHDRLEQPGTQLADSNSIGHVHQQPHQHPAETRQHAQCIATTGSGSFMANANGCGGGEDTEPSELRSTGTEQSPGDSWNPAAGENNQRRFDRWPARPGEQQHDWEQPRTHITEHAARLLRGYSQKHPESFLPWQVEQATRDVATGAAQSALGLTVDGYNFREDFLRALGNGVVEQTAEVAFNGLLNKLITQCNTST